MTTHRTTIGQLFRNLLQLQRTATAAAGIVATVAASGCAHLENPRLAKYDLSKGYRFDSVKLSQSTPSRNSDEMFVILAFSGGGTRAAAMSYGALAQLREVKFHADASGKPVACTPAESPQCKASERSLLDEVDVITSVSGGSFTSAYYALYGDSIFNRNSTFQDKFLYHRVQSDLVKQMVYRPHNWSHLLSRVEIAAEYHAKHIFGDATFADLETRPRPYLVLNATDASTGGRFEFSQEQFDLLCADLSRTPVARGVASSSAFPVLLNSLTIDTHTREGGCGFEVPEWERTALMDRIANPTRYRRALEYRAFRDSARKHLHLLDGGLADNLGLRGVVGRLQSVDLPNQTLPNGSVVTAGWNLMQKLSLEKIKHLVVITVDSRANHTKNWDKKAAGPGIVKVVDASAGIPMGNFTTESIDLMRELFKGKQSEFVDSARMTTMSLSLDEVPLQEERDFLNNTGTNFELPEFYVNCLMSRSAALMRDGSVFDDRAKATSFTNFVQQELKGTIANARVPAPAACTKQAEKQNVKSSSHTIDLAVRYSISRPYKDEIDQREGFGLTLRVAKPNGLGASVGFTMPSFGIPSTVGNRTFTLGRVRLYGLLAGGVLSRQLGPVEVSGAMSAGYAFANFRSSAEARSVFAANNSGDTKVRSSSTWMLKPTVSVWHSVTGKIALMASTSYLVARPTLRFSGENPLLPSRKVEINALQVSAGLGLRIF